MQLYNLEFSEQEIREAAKHDRLLSMEIELSRVCNFRCVYCYQEEGTKSPDELSREEIKNTILQAKDLGARKIIILGGEPTIYPHLVEMLHFLGKQGLEVELFTNGSGVTPSLAQIMAEEGVRVVVKMNSMDGALQDRLAGTRGAYRHIQNAMENLYQAGYPGKDHFLAASTVICRQNLEELPALWTWLRQQGIEPYFEILTPQANAKKNHWLKVDSTELYGLFCCLAEIDQREFGRHWQPQPPLVGNRCMRHQVSCVVTATGIVMPCVGVTIGSQPVARGNLAASGDQGSEKLSTDNQRGLRLL